MAMRKVGNTVMYQDGLGYEEEAKGVVIMGAGRDVVTPCEN
jgi:hypothetical protein